MLRGHHCRQQCPNTTNRLRLKQPRFAQLPSRNCTQYFILIHLCTLLEQLICTTAMSNFNCGEKLYGTSNQCFSTWNIYWNLYRRQQTKMSYELQTRCSLHELSALNLRTTWWKQVQKLINQTIKPVQLLVNFSFRLTERQQATDIIILCQTIHPLSNVQLPATTTFVSTK